VVDLTKNGVAMSYASDGEYIYLDYEPKLSLTYNNTVLEELTPTGALVKALSIPGVVGITGVSNGLVVVQFINGRYALINMNTGAVEPLNTSTAGFSGSLFYYYYNGVLTVVNGTQRLVISLPGFVDAFPVVWRYGLVVIAWRPGLLGVFTWNGALRSIINYTLSSSIIVPGATIMRDVLYLAWFSPLNGTNGRGVIYLATQPLPHPIVTIVTNTTRATTTTTTSTTKTTSTSKTSIITTVWRVLLGLPAWVVVVVVIAVVIAIIVVLLVRRSRSNYDYYYFDYM
jgi:hypothetical protein